jgi:hypothetical protein
MTCNAQTCATRGFNSLDGMGGWLGMPDLRAVHAENGYNVCDNGFKLPLLMLIPLVLSGPGKQSIDHWLRRVMYAEFAGMHAAALSGKHNENRIVVSV